MAQISAEDVANEVGLAADKLPRPCNNSIIPSLADCFSQWRVIFGSLLSDLDLGDVHRENATEGEKRIAALRKWKDRNGRGATYKILIKALLDSGEKYQAESLCKILADHLKDKNGKCQYSMIHVTVLNSDTLPFVVGYLILFLGPVATYPSTIRSLQRCPWSTLGNIDSETSSYAALIDRDRG